MQPHSDAVARVYAEALLRIARDRGVIDDIGTELREIAVLLCTDEAQGFLVAPMIDAAEKKAVLERAFRGQVSDVVLDFICLLVDKRRDVAIGDIAHAYGELADRESRRQRVRARTAVPLSSAQRDKLEDALRVALRSQCIVEANVEPALIGGMVVQVGDTLYDGSIQRRLQRLSQQFMRSGGYED